AAGALASTLRHTVGPGTGLRGRATGRRRGEGAARARRHAGRYAALGASTMPPSPPPPSPPADLALPEPPRRPWWMAKRVALAGLGVVLLSGAATAVLALNEVNKVVEALHQNRAVMLAPRVLAPPSRGGPALLLPVG